MKINRNPYDYFWAAFRKEISDNWKGKRKELADKIGISVPYLSELEHRKKEASHDVQMRICNVIGLKCEDFAAFGRTLIPAEVAESATAQDAADCIVTETDGPRPPPVPLASAPNNVHLLPAREKPPPTPGELQAQAMRDNLEIIIKSGDAEIIESIRSNLVTFKRTVELAMEIRTLKAENKDVRMTGGGYRRQGNLIVVEFCRGCYW